MKIPYKTCRLFIIFEPKTQNDLKHNQESIRFFTMNDMGFRHVEKPYKTCRKWRILRCPECSILGENNIVYGVLNEISQKVRISEFQIAWTGGFFIPISSDCSPPPPLNPPEKGRAACRSSGELQTLQW